VVAKAVAWLLHRENMRYGVSSIAAGDQLFAATMHIGMMIMLALAAVGIERVLS
jgi:hypothetical protein